MAKSPSLPLSSNSQQNDGSTNFEGTSITKSNYFMDMPDNLSTSSDSDLDDIVFNNKVAPGKLHLLGSSPIKPFFSKRDYEDAVAEVSDTISLEDVVYDENSDVEDDKKMTSTTKTKITMSIKTAKLTTTKKTIKITTSSTTTTKTTKQVTTKTK